MNEKKIRAAVTTTLCAAPFALGCGSSSPDPDDAGKEANAGPLYAIMFEVFDDTGSNSYLSLVGSLDADELDPGDAREFPGGRAFLRAHDGAIFVGDAESPEVTRYTVSGKRLAPDGTVSFANFGASAGEIDAWTTTFVSETKAYTTYMAEGVTIVWNPRTMTITGEIAPPEGAVRPGWTLEGSPGVLRGNRLFRTFDWVNYDDQRYLGEQWLAVYDTDTDEIVSVVKEPRCSAMGNLVHRDEAGFLYFSNWIWPVGDTLVNDGPKSCVLRIGPEAETFDAGWQLTYADVAEGREGAMFTYLKDEQALFAAFHEEEAPPLEPSILPNEYVSNVAWRLWSYDMTTGEAAPLAGIGWNTGAFSPVQVDGRTLLMVPGADYSSTRIYDVTGGGARESLLVPGWTYQFAKVR